MHTLLEVHALNLPNGLAHGNGFKVFRCALPKLKASYRLCLSGIFRVNSTSCCLFKLNVVRVADSGFGGLRLGCRRV